MLYGVKPSILEICLSPGLSLKHPTLKPQTLNPRERLKSSGAASAVSRVLLI